MKNPFNKSTHPHCFDGHQYAIDITEGKIPACVYVIGACQRYLKDLENADAGFYFDADRAERYLRIVQRFEHVKGVWPTKNIVYEPWQKWIWMNIMGFYNKDSNFRRFRLVHCELPRGQGKSLMASQCALYFLACDNPVGNEISTLATRREQARIVLDSARAMARKSKSYLKATGVEVLAHTIVHRKSNSFVRAMSSDESGLDGLNDILAVMDELHAMKRETFDVIYSGMSKRRDSLTLCITTAGFDVDSVGYSQMTYAKKVATGEVKDEQFFSAIFTVDEGDDIWNPITWRKANPAWGISVDPVTFEAKALKAKETPSDIPNFKVKHLNIWLSEMRAFYDTAKWDLCADPTLKLEDFKGQKCITSLDLASKIDLTSIGIIFRKDGIYYIFDKSFIPEDTVKDVRNSLYENCIGTGHLISTPGGAIDHERIRKEVLDLKRDFKIQEMAYDPWNATELAQTLVKDRVEMLEFRMNTSNLSEPTKQLDALIRQGKIRHNGSPLLRWAISNVVCKEDAAGNVFPRKSHEKLKIDPAIALIMALAVWIQKEEKESIYETRGIRFL